MSTSVPKPYLASYGSRAAAYLLDLLVILPVLVTLGTIVQTEDDSQATAQIVIGSAFLLSQFLYPPFMLARGGQRNGQTLGKQWMGIRVVRADARPITLGEALLREGVGKGLLGIIPLFNPVDLLFPLADRHAQSIHDKLISSYVVDAAPLADGPRLADLPPPSPPDAPAHDAPPPDAPRNA